MNGMSESGSTVSRSPARRLMLQRPGWWLVEHHCTAGPGDVPFEERHENVAIALVRTGTFTYRTDQGEAVLSPGSFLLGNAEACFECGHEHSVGDVCTSVHVSRSLFEEVSATAAGSSGLVFRSVALPPARRYAPLAFLMEQLARAHDSLEADERFYELIESLLGCLQPGHARAARPSSRDVQRISRTVRYMDHRAAMPLTLEMLARRAAMSKYHFLRTFRRLVGTTPHQYLLTRRLQRIVLALQRERTPIGELALAHGFDDLSTFNKQFRRTYRATPQQIRARGTL